MTAADAKTVLRAAYMDAHKGQEPAQELRAEVDALIAAVEAGTLDRAWAEAEAALPEGWVPVFVKVDDDDWTKWGAATASRAYFDGETDDDTQHVHAYADTPAAALQALAERLRAER